MDLQNEKRPALWKCLLAFLLAFFVWLVGLFAMDGGLHQFAHGGTDCEPSGAVCAIALFGAGAVDTAPSDIAVMLPSDGFQELAAATDRILPAPLFAGSTSARGPPCFLIQV